MASTPNLAPEPLKHRKPFQFRLRTLLLVVTGFAVLLSLCSTVGVLLDYLDGPISESNFNKVKIGMSLREVESILGPGKQIQADQVMRISRSPDAQGNWNFHLVVDGDLFYEWDQGDRAIELGTKHGKVCDKWYGASGL